MLSKITASLERWSRPARGPDGCDVLVAPHHGTRTSLPPDLRMIVDPEPPWVQFAAVVALATLLLAAAGVILAWRQFPPAEES